VQCRWKRRQRKEARQSSPTSPTASATGKLPRSSFDMCHGLALATPSRLLMIRVNQWLAEGGGISVGQIRIFEGRRRPSAFPTQRERSNLFFLPCSKPGKPYRQLPQTKARRGVRHQKEVGAPATGEFNWRVPFLLFFFPLTTSTMTGKASCSNRLSRYRYEREV
jgi:hypothetical protein